MTPAQEAALGNYLRLAVQAVSPGMQLRIVRGSNAPLPELGSAVVRLPSSVSDSPVELPYYIADPEDDTQLLERVVERGQQRVELELRVAEPPDTASSAYHLVSAIRRLLGRERLIDELRDMAIGVVSVGDVIDVSAFVRDSQWESRAQLVLEVSYALAEDSRVPKIASAEIAGTISALPLTIAPE